MAWKTLDEMDLDGKRVLVRVDINVPMVEGVVTDSTRIRRITPTIRDILKAGGHPILLAHFGRPKGERRANLSLEQLIPTLQRAFECKVDFAADCVGREAELAAENLMPGHVLLLENTRFHAEETKNDPVLAAGMAKLGDVYCNDAFSAAHRAHCSTEGLAHLLPSCAGRLMQAELRALEAALSTPKRPVTAVVGGAKVSTKLDLLSNLIEKVDNLIIGGGMANTFLTAKGYQIGNSLAERLMAPTAKEIMAKAEEKGCNIILPVDVVVASKFAANAPCETVPVTECPADKMILDAGPLSVDVITKTLKESHTLIWNGPLGAFEIEPFDTATNAAALQAAALTKAGKLISVAGGGDTVSALNASGAAKDFTYISTAGGAFLEWMEGKVLPGVAALEG